MALTVVHGVLSPEPTTLAFLASTAWRRFEESGEAALGLSL